MRFVVATLLALVWGADAYALGVSSLKLSRNGVIIPSADYTYLVNAAHCNCAEQIDASIGFSDLTTSTGDVVIAIGTRCIDTDGRLDDSCTIAWQSPVSEVSAVEEISLSIEKLAAGDCSARTATENIEILVDANDDDNWTSLFDVSFGVDTAIPPTPVGETVVAGEGLAVVAFAANDNAETGTRYQVLCSKSGEVVFSTPPEAVFESAADLCDGTGPREAFVCAEADDSTASVTVTELEDGVTYDFEVVAIDRAGNPSSVESVGRAKPAKEEDLWERYRRSGGTADGEGCFVATAVYGDYDHPTVRWLRVFRDTVLKRSSTGQAFIDFYYQYGPVAASKIEGDRVLGAAARALVADLHVFTMTIMMNGASR